jgi:hypothetical protein
VIFSNPGRVPLSVGLMTEDPPVMEMLSATGEMLVSSAELCKIETCAQVSRSL